ncbi:MAG TPA: cystathionine gamma-synthase [Acidimicrobiales bacterium]|nr:cystathionine gamma-synthase [Acidimicrobiales bacterium]
MTTTSDSSDHDGFETRAIHAGQDPDAETGSVVPAVHLASTFRQRVVGGEQAYEYARSGNPTRASLEQQMASLEGAAHAYAFASGLAAEDAVLRALLTAGDHVILPLDAYGGTFRLVDNVHKPAGIDSTTTDLATEESLAAAWRDETRLVWVETPSNPSLSIVDIAATAAFVHGRGAVLVVDNTFATPFLQNPLALGADVVVHSTTKYLGGHSDVVGGLAATNDPDIAARIAFLQNATGAVPGPWDCYLIQRGAKTLALRMERHCANAGVVAGYLHSHVRVAKTYYPGLTDHPGHGIAVRQMRGFGGIVSFLHAGGETDALAMVARTRLFTLAESLGAVESLIEHPGRMTHAVLAQSSLAVDPSLIRLSVGIESIDDLLEDLDAALRG